MVVFGLRRIREVLIFQRIGEIILFIYCGIRKIYSLNVTGLSDYLVEISEKFCPERSSDK